jgi:predicted transcriptional regulator of viral defense system
VADTIRFGNQGTIRRIGALLEREGVKKPLLNKLQSRLQKTTSVIPWIPTLPKRGKTDARWGVVFNERA